MNAKSSRSHAVLNVFVEQRWVEKEGTVPTSPNPVDQQSTNLSSPIPSSKKKKVYRKALLTIVDLAGSERLSKTGSEGMRLQEAKTINKSIAALSNCVSALASAKSMSFVPFRDSKLTRLLSESLGGNCKTTICACISPSMMHYDESYSTLLFATRAMSVKTRVIMNERIEYKNDDSGRPISPMSAFTSQMQSQNEIQLFRQNSALVK